jgi:hypothetical protein
MQTVRSPVFEKLKSHPVLNKVYMRFCTLLILASEIFVIVLYRYK